MEALYQRRLGDGVHHGVENVDRQPEKRSAAVHYGLVRVILRNTGRERQEEEAVVSHRPV